MSYDFHTLVNPPDGHYTTLRRQDGTRLRCVCAGEGPTVVLAHGVMGSLSAFNAMFDDLVEHGYRVLAFDQRGHGASTVGADGMGSRAMADDYRAILEHFDVRDGVLVGHSMGAFLAIVFALEHSEVARERLRGLLLLGGHAGNVAKGSVGNRLQIPLIRWGVTKKLLSSKRAGHALMRPLFGEEADPTVLEALRQLCVSSQRFDLSDILNDMVREDFYPRLREVGIDAVVVCGERDATCPRWHSERLGAEISAARNVWLPGVGHMLPYEAPEVVLREIGALGA